MELEINVIDAFTDSVFKGNPAAVIITDNWLTDNLMQSIALENNLSETAFLVKHVYSRSLEQKRFVIIKQYYHYCF